jgi:hypothetical protein
MVAAEFTARDDEPDTAMSKAVVSKWQQNRLLLLTCGAYDNVVRWIPPLVVNEEQVRQAAKISARLWPARRITEGTDNLFLPRRPEGTKALFAFMSLCLGGEINEK